MKMSCSMVSSKTPSYDEEQLSSDQMGKTIRVSGFPCLVPAEDVKELLENLTGQGTIVALEVKPSNRGPRPYARVQFTDVRHADRIIELANNRFIYYGTSYLKAWDADKDIVQNPRTFVQEMEQVTLNFGCQVSRERFSVLWKAESVSVKFGTGMKKMHFFLSHNLVEYKLQLSYENIWQIVLYNSRSETRKLLLIQLFGAPRIYKKLKESIFSYYSSTQDDQWIRTTDFTPSHIGQSSGLCIQLPYGMRLPNLKDNFVYYKESQDPFSLQTGFPFADTNSSLVPIINPPRGFDLPYRILFKICSLVQTGCLPGPNIDSTFYRLVDPRTSNIRYIEHALEKMYYLKECCYWPATWLNEQYEKYRTNKEQPSSPSISLDDGLVYVHRVQITPTRVYFSGPEVNMSNRVLRHYKDQIDNFLRVSFVDEEWEKMYSTDLAPKVAVGEENKRTKLYERVISTLQDGIKIGNKQFDFLAFSSSQLRDNSLWMFAPNNYLDADGIREWMGDFRSIRNVAKYAARLGQSFGSSTETLTVDEYDVENIDDIKDLRNKYIFSDGIGKISADFARRVAIKCGFKGSTPSAFQIRYGGYKGVVAVDPFSNTKLSLRPSMLKYQSDNKKLDVLSWSKYQPCFMNRQIITLLSTLGVRDRVFEEKQREAVEQLDDILVDPVRAQETLDLMYPGENTNILKEMLKCGYKPDGEPFLSMMLQAFRSSKLLDLRLRARVFIPRARQMMGCLDETGTLRYGQVFVQYSGAGRGRFDDDDESDNCNYIVQGKVVVAKNPCLHPGDVRVLEAVNVPALYHMVDCVVFPIRGERPHPNECSGSDLDGDIYFVCWDKDLIPPKQVSPMDYSPAPTITLDHDVTIKEVEEYFTNYIVNDSLGIIANAHTVFADKELTMAMSEPCLELARLFSIAVDFPKTGVPAEIPPHLRVKEYPDFMDKPDKTTYISTRVIGKLFREVKDKAPRTATITSFTKSVAAKSYDPDLEVDGFQEYVDEAFDYKTEYDYKLGNLMDYYGIKTEAEILSGGIMKMSKTFDRRKDAEAIGAAVRALRNEARAWFKKGSEMDDVYAKASAWYHVTYHPDFWGSYNEGLKRDHYISFPWCVYDRLVKIKKDKVRAKEVAGLGREFGRRLRLR
ncbi:multidrug resistance protein [Castilleja foliolosa]|uniref:RNA-dependent RNA polymerase n=1 Tax=Castilleja foliolosa TaxID=1961234 RepID=A0ABD3EIU0_9LAMI